MPTKLCVDSVGIYKYVVISMPGKTSDIPITTVISVSYTWPDLLGHEWHDNCLFVYSVDC